MGQETSPEQESAIAASKPPILPHAQGWLWLGLKLAVSIGILAFAVSRVDFSSVTAAFARMTPQFYVLAVLASVSVNALAGYRWSTLTRRMASPISAKEGVTTYFGASFVGQILPSTLGMDAVRAWAAARRHKPVSEVLGAIMVDRAFGFVGLAVLLLLGAPRLLSMGDRHIGELATIAAFVLIGGAVIGGVALMALLRMKLTGKLERVQALARTVLATIRTRRGALALPISVLIHGLLTTSVMLTAFSLGAQLSPWDGWATIPAAMLIATIPISINGWGLREGAMIACLGLAGVPASEAFATSVLFGFGQMIAATPGAAFWLWSRTAPATTKS